MLSLTKKTEYGLMALLHLNRNGNRYYSAREISEVCHIPLPLLMNILKMLAQHDIVRSFRGARGGYKLSISPKELSLSCVVQALEGPVKLVRCVSDHGEEVGFEDRCQLQGCCSIRSPLLQVHEEFERFLGNITLASLTKPEVTEVRILRSLNSAKPRASC